ncbi:dihydroneopterin aldolase [Thermocoleostomius sinensis]|jgi:dihydroneopterin aldolase|uniref:7,8-dihydroneopterin aldolase n=1 Tax=Thermocoleostomius sinensis A174 TaxID=2016057 RepID=A0A9E8ZED2_9CYAN|nr:dihydroneopterin aldolase [Thermocoleostomius sinensis]WAL61603.1 dihydroneopterin aldolase [Thermocoleostomius sinensis A174]
MDTLNLTGIRAYGYVGALPEEQTLGQWFEVDLTLWLDLAPAGASDRLDDTYDYVAIVQAVQTLIRTIRCQLIETLAAEIAQRVLASDQVAKVAQVRVRLTKLTPPIPDFAGRVAVEITRSRQPV